MPAGSYVKVSARKWLVECSTDARVTWTAVHGLTTFAFSKSSTRTDTTDFVADGIETGEIMARGASCKLDGFFLEDSTKARDPGQAAVETFNEATGAASVGDFRLTSPNGKLYVFSATVEQGDMASGNNNDKTKWAVTLTRSGALTIT